MTMPAGIPIVDTMIGFPREGFGQYDFIRSHSHQAVTSRLLIRQPWPVLMSSSR
jgi:hypothetical protein